jgi:hypothetical protein
MVLLLAGARRSLRARPRPAPALLAAAYAWAAANGWRATFLRVSEVRRGGALEHGGGELWAVAIATGIALGCLALSLYLVVRADRPPPAAVDDPRSTADAKDLSLPHRLDRCEHGRSKRPEVLHPIASRPDHHHADIEVREVLLELDALIRREENVEPVLAGAAQERTVLDTAPALLLNRRAGETGQLARELPWERFV